jgi:hypothetical protein
MSWIKKILGLKEKEKPIKVEPKPEVFDEERPERVKHECYFCKKSILNGERWTKAQGKWFHKKCKKSMIKQFS